MHHEKIEENVEDVENVGEVGQDEEVHAETTNVPLIDLVLAQQILSFLKGFIGPGVISSVQATQYTTNPPIPVTTPRRMERLVTMLSSILCLILL